MDEEGIRKSILAVKRLRETIHEMEDKVGEFGDLLSEFDVDDQRNYVVQATARLRSFNAALQASIDQMKKELG